MIYFLYFSQHSNILKFISNRLKNQNKLNFSIFELNNKPTVRFWFWRFRTRRSYKDSEVDVDVIGQFGLLPIKLLLKQYQESNMIYPKQHSNYIDTQLPKIKQPDKNINPQETTALQSRACSSLCQLSANICRDENTERELERHPISLPVGCSPWTIKKKSEKNCDTPLKPQKKGKTRIINELQNVCTNYKSSLDNKENVQTFSKGTPGQQALKKNTSIFFKIVGLREGKRTVNFRSEHPDIEMIACVERKKFSLVETKDQSERKRESKNEVGVQVNRQLTPKLVTLSHNVFAEPPKSRSKQLQTSLLENWSQQLRENKDVNIYTEHWKSRSKNIRNKYQKKIVVVRQSKSSQAKQARQTCLIRKKGSVSLERTKKEQYKTNNPLTRLLYQKYLHTIGMCQIKDNLAKFL